MVGACAVLKGYGLLVGADDFWNRSNVYGGYLRSRCARSQCQHVLGFLFADAFLMTRHDLAYASPEYAASFLCYASYHTPDRPLHAQRCLHMSRTFNIFYSFQPEARAPQSSPVRRLPRVDDV